MHLLGFSGFCSNVLEGFVELLDGETTVVVEVELGDPSVDLFELD